MVACCGLAQTPATPKIGGQDVVVLKRKPTSDGKKLEFLSVTLFPGRGMNMFQMTANVPGKGEIPLILAPSVEEAAQRMTGSGADKWANVSHTFGGAFLIPYANLVGGEVSADGQHLTASWHGRSLTLPANATGRDPANPRRSLHGLINGAGFTDLKTRTIPDGQEETAILHGGDFEGQWPSSTDLSFTLTLTGTAVDIRIRATNVGKEDEPMSIGWHPYFAIPSGDRSQARLRLPADTVMEAKDAIPSGRLLPVDGTPFDFRAPNGIAMGSVDYNNNLSTFHRTQRGIDAEVIDPASNYGLHVESLSPEIKTVQIFAPVSRPFIAVEPQFNFPDPFNPVWKSQDTGMVTLAPGKSTLWEVKLELFAPNSPK